MYSVNNSNKIPYLAIIFLYRFSLEEYPKITPFSLTVKLVLVITFLVPIYFPGLTYVYGLVKIPPT